jgi:hypothetical protein
LPYYVEDPPPNLLLDVPYSFVLQVAVEAYS